MTRLEVPVNMLPDMCGRGTDQLCEVVGHLHMSHTAPLGLVWLSKCCADTACISSINHFAEFSAKLPFVAVRCEKASKVRDFAACHMQLSHLHVQLSCPVAKELQEQRNVQCRAGVLNLQSWLDHMKGEAHSISDAQQACLEECA